MSDLSVTPLAPELLRTIDPVCDAFEADWRENRRPAIEDRLGSVAEAVRPVLLSDLIRTELEWRIRLGDSPTPEEYRTRFPSCAGAIEDWLAEARTSVHQFDAAAAAETTPPERPSAGTGGPGRTAAGAAPPLRTLGNYDLLEPLQAGGMGEVYKARNRLLNKVVALKLLHGHFHASAGMVARFLREMKAVGGLNHPNVVAAHDAGEEQGVGYLVMEWIDGSNLSQLVGQGGPLAVAEACAVARQAALGLQHLHACDLVHRDVKPSNLMRTPDGVVKVLDLGLARWGRGAAGAEDLTDPGLLMGTPDYIAPEQSSDPTRVDSRADLYGLGGTLFYLLTGRAPFAHREGTLTKLNAHASEAPPDVRDLRPETPAELAEVVNRLLAKPPEERPQTAAEVAATLDRLARGHAANPASLPGETVPRSPAVTKTSRPSRLVVGACGLAALLGLAVLIAGRSWRPKEEGGAVVDRVQVLGLDVKHFANVKGGFDQPRGLLGKDSFAARRDDSVTVEARLSRPAQAFLIAFRPDGTEEVCFPEREDEVPPLTDRPRYPSVSRGVNYGLNEGVGLQVFAVVVSSRPLPAYQEWRALRGGSPWKHSEAPAGVVWRDDGINVDALTVEDPAGQRGKGRDVSGKTPIANLTDWLRQAPDVEVAAVGFAVLPKDGR